MEKESISKREKILRQLERIKFPIGEAPPRDPELDRIMNELDKKGATLAEVFKAIAEWEPEAVRRDRQMENTKLTGRLDYRTALRDL